MPSNKNPLTTTVPGAGKLHADIATASAQIFAAGGGGAALLAFLNLVAQRDLAIVKRTAPVAAAGQGSFDLRAVETDPIWVSDSGGTALDDLFILVEVGTDGASFKAAGGSIIVISSITAAVGDGFVTGALTLIFSSALPTGPTFEIWYAVQRQVASITADSFSFPNIRQVRGISRVSQELLEDLHAAVGQAWDDSWDSTIEALAASGLDERYRRKTAVAGSFNFDTPGDGAIILRDGVAPQSLATEAFSDYPNTPIVDPFWAQWRTGISGVDQGSIPVPNVRDGGMGFVSIGSRRNTSDANELTRIALSAGSQLTAHPRNITASTLNAADVRTRVDATVACTLNPDSGATPTNMATLAVTGTNFFVNGSGNTEVAVGYDLLRIEYTGGLSSRQDEVYIIESILSTTRVLLRMLSGGVPSFPSGVATTDCRCQLIKTVFHMGGGAAPWLTSGAQLDAALFHAVIPSVTDDPATATEVAPNPARFLAAARTATEYSHTGSPVPNALEWGGFDPTLTAPQVFPGKLRGDGGIDATIVSNTTRAISISTSGTTTWHPGLEGSILHVDFTHASGTITWTLAMHADYEPVDGERLEVILRPAPNAPPTGTAEVTIVWPVSSPNTFFGWGTAGIIINEISRIKLTHFSGSGFSGWLLSQTNLQNISYIQKVPFLEPRDLSGLTGGGAITWRPMSEGGYLTLRFDDALAYSFVLTGESGTVVFPSGGFQIAIEIEQGPGGATMTWPGNFTFSGGDATLPPNAGDRVLYRGLYSNLATKWLMTRTDY